MTSRLRSRLSLLALLLMGLAGFAAILYATRWGAALSDDSYYYIQPARQLLQGRPFLLSPHYPPGLPLLLAGIGLSGLDPQAGIRLLNAACFGLNIFLAGSLVRRMTGSGWLGSAAGLLLLLAQPMIEVHAWAMSEALFLSLVLGGVLCLGQYLEGRKAAWLAAGALLAGLSGLVRYAGLALIAAGVLGLLLAPGRKFTRRLLDAGGFGLASGLIYALYPLISAAATREIGQTGGFQLGLPTRGSLIDLCYNTLLWLMPGRLARGHEILVMALVLAGLGALAVLASVWRKTAFKNILFQAAAEPRWILLALFGAASFGLLYQANQSATYRSPFDFRLLAPTHLALLLLALVLLGLAWKQGGRYLHVLMAVLFIYGAGLYASRALDTLQLYHARGMGFATPYWVDSDAIQAIRSLPAATPVVTTAPMGVYFSTGREAQLFAVYTPEQLAAYLKEKQAVFVFFQSMPFGIYDRDEKSYLSKLKLVQRYSDAALYQAP